MGKTFSTGLLTNGIWQDASNNIGIGGSPSGSFKLEVTGTAKVSGALTGASLNVAGSGYFPTKIITLTGAEPTRYSGNIGLNIIGGSSIAMSFGTRNNNTDYDNTLNLFNGNVGIGTTPSAWANITALEFPYGISFGSYTGAAIPNSYITNNAYYNGTNWIYKVSSYPATMQSQTSTGDYQFNTAASGTAGNIVTFDRKMTITNGGNVLIGQTTAFYGATNRTCLELNGSATSILGVNVNGGIAGYLYADSTDTYVSNSRATGRLYATSNSAGVYLTTGATAWTANSDERLKNIHSNIENAVESLMTLRTVKHSWKSDNTNKEHLALIAQDVEKVFPQVIDIGKLPNSPSNPSEDETEYLGVRYTELIPVLIAAIKEQQIQIQELSAQNQDLKSRLDKAGL